MPSPPVISLTDLASTGLRLRPAEAVTIVRELISRTTRGELPGMPSAQVLRFTADGEIFVEGPVAAGQTVERAGRLLEAILPGFDAPPEVRAPGALRLVLARALRTLDLPAYVTLADFDEALRRFAHADAPTVVRSLVSAHIAAKELRTASPASALAALAPDGELGLTVSDVRRARRATGLTLSEISSRARIPASLLRELEWGYYVNWPTGPYGRTQLVRYARASGLDEQTVIRTLLPEIESAWAARACDERDRIDVIPPPELERRPLETTSLVRVDGGPPAVIARSGRRRAWAAALAIPALLAIGLLPALWNGDSGGEPGPQEPARVSVRTVDPRPASPATIPAPRTDTGAVPMPSAQPAALRGDVAFSPAFASVGSAMFYHSDTRRGSEIVRADTDASGAVLRVTTIVDDDAKNFHARPSPDGRSIAFDSDRDGERAVYLADANGRNVRRVSGEGFAAVPSWSPDGSRIAYVRAESANPRVWNLWTLDLATGETKKVTSHRTGQPWGGAWFPDGRRIAYSHERRLVIKDLETMRTRTFAAPRGRGWIRTPAVSPDGRRIIFQVHGDGAWLMDVDDGGMRKVLSDPTAEEFTWSPDGQRVAYHSRRAGKWGVWIMAPR